MNRDFQSAFELYVEGNGTSKRPRTRSTSSLPLFKEQYQSSTKSDTDMVTRNQSNRSRSYHKSRSFCSSNLSQLIHKNNSLRRKSICGTSSSMSFRNRPQVTYEGSREIGRKQSFKESSSATAEESLKKNDFSSSVTESKTSDSFDCMTAHIPEHEPVLLGRDEALGVGGSCDSAGNLSQHSRLVVKITQKKFCQLKCIEMEPQNMDSEEKPAAMNSNSERWLRKSQSRTEVETKLVRNQSSKDKVVDKSLRCPPGRRIVRSKVLKSKLVKGYPRKQRETVKKAIKSESKEENISSDTVEASSQVEQRPRRNIVPKKLSDTSGLSWKEETDLKKALYASLQKQRNNKGESGSREVTRDERPEKFSAAKKVLQIQTSHSNLRSQQQGTLKGNADNSGPIGVNNRNIQTVETNNRLLTRSSASIRQDCSVQMNYRFSARSNSSHPVNCFNLWTNKSSDGIDGSCHKTDFLYTILASDKKIESSSQVRAQRKFAHSSRPGTPTLALRRKVSQNGPRKDCKPKTVATEDFLTFLCLRGTDLLPPHLDLFNYSESESLQSFPNTPHESPDISQPDTPSPDPPALPFQEPGSSSAFPNKQQSDMRKLPQACHSLKVVSTVPSLSSAISGSHSQLSQATHSKTRPSSQQVNGPSLSKTLLPSHAAVKQGNLRDTDKVRKVKAVESQTRTDRKRVDVSLMCMRSSTADSGQSKSVDNRSQQLLGDQASASTGKDCIPDSSQNCCVGEMESLQSLPSSEQGASSSEASENRTRPTTRSRTAAQMQKQLTMARMWDDRDVHQVTKEKLKDKMATDRTNLKNELVCSSASSSVSSSQQQHLNSVVTDFPAKKQNFISLKSAKEPSHSENQPLTRKRSSSKGQGVGDGEAHSGPPNEQERTSFSSETKRRRITGCKSHSWKKLRLLRSMSSPPSCKQGSESSKEALTEIRSCTESEGDVDIAATWRNKDKRCEESNVTGEISEGPTYRPSIEQFQDPARCIDSITPHAIPSGLCRIIPPEGWEVECCLPDDLSFNTEVQCINRFLDKSYMKIKMMVSRLAKKFAAVGTWMTEVIGKVLDGKALMEAVDKHGGFEMAQSQGNWATIGSLLGIEDVKVLSLLPDLYCHYYLESLGIILNCEKPCCADATENSVNAATKESSQLNSQVRSRTLKDFFNFAKAFDQSGLNPGAKQGPTSCEIEKMFWDLVVKSGDPVEVEMALIDTKHCGSAFPSKSDAPYSKHEWNFNVLQNNPNSILNYLGGSISDVTIPVLQVGMRFSSSFWSIDQHHLPFIHYLHTGDDIIWYCVRAADVEKLRTALAYVYPGVFIPTNPLALFEIPTMVSPEALALHGISMSRIVQKRGEFIIVFPQSVTCNISCGYNVAEILHFATPDWIPFGHRAAQLLHSSRWPELFSMDHLLLQIAKSSTDVMTEDAARILLTCLDNELQQRAEMIQLGLKCFEAIPARRLNRIHRERQTARCHIIQDEEKRCIMCSRICHISMLVDEKHDLVFCLKHGIQYLKEHQRASFSKLLYRFDEKTLTGMTMKLQSQLEDRCNRKDFGSEVKKQQKLTRKLKY